MQSQFEEKFMRKIMKICDFLLVSMYLISRDPSRGFHPSIIRVSMALRAKQPMRESNMNQIQFNHHSLLTDTSFKM